MRTRWAPPTFTTRCSTRTHSPTRSLTSTPRILMTSELAEIRELLIEIRDLPRMTFAHLRSLAEALPSRPARIERRNQGDHA